MLTFNSRISKENPSDKSFAVVDNLPFPCSLANSPWLALFIFWGRLRQHFWSCKFP